MLKKIKIQIVNDGIYEEFWILKCLYFLEKDSMIFQNSLIKSLMHKIKKHKNFYNFLTSTDRKH